MAEFSALPRCCRQHSASKYFAANIQLPSVSCCALLSPELQLPASNAAATYQQAIQLTVSLVQTQVQPTH